MGFDDQGLGQESGRLKLVNALAHRGRAWARLTFGQAQMLACADLLACAFIAISVAVYGSGSVWMWQCVAAYQRQNKWQCVKCGYVAVCGVM